MKWLLVLGLAIALVGASQTQAFVVKESPYVEIWTDRGDGAIYHAGEAAAIFIRPQQDCYVIVYEIDTDGYLRVLFPSDCFYDGFVRGGRIYRIGRGPLRRLYVSGPAGVAYVHVIASFEPFRTIYWHGCSGYDAYAYDVTWRGFTDYWGCALPPRIYGDPYVAMESIDEFICLDRIEFGVVWADFTYFYVDTRVPYPRYVCYDCHGFSSHVRPYSSVASGSRSPSSIAIRAATHGRGGGGAHPSGSTAVLAMFATLVSRARSIRASTSGSLAWSQGQLQG